MVAHKEGRFHKKLLYEKRACKTNISYSVVVCGLLPSLFNFIHCLSGDASFEDK